MQLLSYNYVHTSIMHNKLNMLIQVVSATEKAYIIMQAIYL